jgi:hypothetical protein
MIFQDKQSRPIINSLAELKKNGYQLSFRREATCIYCFELGKYFMPEDFVVDESYFLEDTLNPDEDRILYAISLVNGGLGYLIDACNVYSDNISYEMEQKLKWQYPLFT